MAWSIRKPLGGKNSFVRGALPYAAVAGALAIPGVLPALGTPGGMALLGGGLGALGSIYGGKQQSKAIGEASERELQGTREAISAQQKAIEEERALYKPYRDIGEAMLPQLGEELGVTYDVATGKYIASGKPITESPLYKWQLEQGLKTIRDRNSPQYFGSGFMAKLESDYANRLAAEETDKRYGRIRDLVGLGSGFSGQQAGAESRYGGALSNLYAQSGINQGNLYTERGKARGSMYGTLGQGILGGTQGYLNYLQGQNTNDVLRQQLALMQGMPKNPNIDLSNPNKTLQPYDYLNRNLYR